MCTWVSIGNDKDTEDNDRSACGSLPPDGNDHAKIDWNRRGGKRKNHCKSRGSMTVVDPLLQKTDQSAHVPFETRIQGRFNAAATRGTSERLRTRVEPGCAGYWYLCTDPLLS